MTFHIGDIVTVLPFNTPANFVTMFAGQVGRISNVEYLSVLDKTWLVIELDPAVAGCVDFCVESTNVRYADREEVQRWSTHAHSLEPSE